MSTITRKNIPSVDSTSTQLVVSLTLRPKTKTQAEIHETYILRKQSDTNILPSNWFSFSASVKKTPPSGTRDSYTAIIFRHRTDFPKDLSGLIFTVNEETALPNLSISFDSHSA